jgi:4-carboxymuconolactone decarboxylase
VGDSGSPEQAGRAPWLRPSDLDAAQSKLYTAIAGGPRASVAGVVPVTDDQGRLLGPFNVMLLSPQLGAALEPVGAVLRFGLSLTDRIREIAILEVAQHARSEFEWYAHVRIGRAAGLTATEVEAVRVGAPVDLAPDEALARQVTQALARTGDLTDDLFAAAEATFGRAALNELVTLVGYYQLLALSMRVWRTPLPAGVDSVF